MDQAKRLKELARQNERLKKAVSELTLDKADPRRGSHGKILLPCRKLACADHVRSQLLITKRRACGVVGQSRMTQRCLPKAYDDDAALATSIERLAKQYGRYGY